MAPAPVILILQTGDVPAGIMSGWSVGNFDRMFLNAADYGGCEVEVIHAHKEALPNDAVPYAGVIVTGSPAMVSDREGWSEAAAAWLARGIDRGLAVLGVCYGHQLVAHALGGRVGWHPAGKELGTHMIRLTDTAAGHPLLDGLPQEFPANLSHSQSVLVPPAGAKILAASGHEPYQILAYGERVLTLQFHPEFTGPIMQAYVDYEAARPKNGRPERPANLGTPVLDTPDARRVLQNFVDIAGGKATGRGEPLPS